MEPTSERLTHTEWSAIAAIPTISKLLHLPPEHAGEHLEENYLGVKAAGIETDDSEGDVFLLYAGDPQPWVIYRRKGCACPHLHVAFGTS